MSAGVVGDSPLFLIDYAVRLLRVLVLLGLWRIILGGRPNVGPMPLEVVLTYTLIGEVFAEQLALRTPLHQAFWEGSIVVRFLRPMGLVRQLSAEMLGRWAVHFSFFSIPLLLLAPVLGVDPHPASLTAGLLFAVSLVLAVLIGLALEMFFGALTVGLEQPVWLVDWMRKSIETLLSGSLLPLALYPWGIGDVFAWLPFAATAWAPLAIFTGTGNPYPLLASQLVWALILWPASEWLWRANREKLVAYGG